ncbi:MFS transporter [Roseomonas elaeocarpi]|uniref:MFS transporter n=1 Tax=Roseomonas elaeocarpi TaxID=907779 RepID=A0ABV6JMA0_9PROT
MASSYVGSVVEWFDFFIYSVASASVFNVLFFPNESEGVGTLLALATLAIGYLVRPIGGVIYGHFGDRIGRKKMLVSSIVLMGAATVVIGFMPTYAQIGALAPILLLTLRVIQGLAVAGEWGGALLMTLEHAGKGRRGVSSCVIGMGQCTGLMLGTFVFSLVSRLPQDQFLSWGWRLPFLGAVVLIALGLWMRLGIEESPVFLKQKQMEARQPVASARPPIMDVLQHGWRQVLQCFMMVLGPFSISALISPFCISYAVQAGFPRVTALNAATVAALCQVVGMLVGGWLSDKVGRRPVFMVGAVLMAVCSFIMFRNASSGDAGLLTLGFALAGLSHGFMFGPLGAFIAELFHTGTRFTGASLGYQLGGAFGGGVAPVIGTSLVLLAGGPPNIGYLLVFSTLVCVCSFVVAVLSRETYRDDLTEVGTGPAA